MDKQHPRKMDFQSELTSYEKKYKKKEKLLEVLLRREVELQELAGDLEKKLVEANSIVVAKEVEVGRLTRRVDKLREERKRRRRAHRKKKGRKEEDSKSSCSEGKDPIFIFPEELWRIIFTHVTDWKDLESCTQVCSFFKRLVDPFNTIFPFYKVIPHLYKHLTPNELLNCRLACQAWSAGVDNLFENHKSLRAQNDEDKDTSQYPPFIPPMQEMGLGRSYTYTSSNEFDFRPRGQTPRSIYQRMIENGGRTRNPIIGRNIGFNGRCDVTRQFLQAFGKHLWYLSLHDGGPFENNETLLRLILFDESRLLPNLKQLRIIGFNYNMMCESKTLTKSLPNAPNLETLYIEHSFYQPSGTHPLPRALLKKYHPQLRRLHVRIENWNQVSQLKWTNLAELHISKLKNREELEGLFQLNIPTLRKIGLSPTQSMLKPISSSFDKLVELIDELSITSKSLTSLRLAGDIQDKFSGKRATVHALAPPTLKTLEVEHSRRLSSVTWYTFLLHFPFIENVNVFWRKLDEGYQFHFDCDANDIQLRSRREYDDYPMHNRKKVRDQKILETKRRIQGEVVEVNKHIYKGTMYQSNVWELLPRLKVFSFQGDVYTREGYNCEKAKERNQQQDKVARRDKKGKSRPI